VQDNNDFGLSTLLPTNKTLTFNKVSFSYAGAGNEPVLKEINFTIPEKKITAIVGSSGSGKTTLIKLLLRFYNNYSGKITVGSCPSPLERGWGEALNPPLGGGGAFGGGGTSLSHISPKHWRTLCGSVMQDSFIFSDSIAKNIALGDETPNYEKLLQACTVANILPFIETMPLGFNTKIGAEGNGISQGQKQRLLIARAVYKNPDYLFFDEATNALDANNEKIIMENLNQFFKEKTVVIVAHRLSTVKNADNIIVLEDGKIIEQGNHDYLSAKRGKYYELVKNQLELGN
jgi:ATP-binding cassette, subfamily B, bacterial